MKKSTAVLSSLVLAGLLTGCEANVNTRIEVDGATQSHITSTVTFTDEAALQLQENEELNDQLVTLIEGRTGVSPEQESDDNIITYTVDLTYEQLTSGQDVFGVGSVEIENVNENQVTVNTQLVAPTGLTEAITQATSTQEDGQALADAMLETTTVGVDVVLPGGVENVEPGSYETPQNAEDNTIFSVVQDLRDFQPGTFTVTGDPSESFLQQYGLWLGAGGVVLVVLVVVANSRRRADA